VERSNPVFFNEIATHLSGARNDRLGERFLFLNRDLGTIVSLTNPAFLDKEIADNGSLEKAKPFERRGRKAAGPAKGGMAELPKVEPEAR
jgi:hypothetical protein